MLRLKWKMGDGTIFIMTVIGLIIVITTNFLFALAYNPTLIDLILFLFGSIIVWFMFILMINSLFSLH
jgi:hypothetical protein